MKLCFPWRDLERRHQCFCMPLLPLDRGAQLSTGSKISHMQLLSCWSWYLDKAELHRRCRASIWCSFLSSERLSTVRRTSWNLADAAIVWICFLPGNCDNSLIIYTHIGIGHYACLISLWQTIRSVFTATLWSDIETLWKGAPALFHWSLCAVARLWLELIRHIWACDITSVLT